MRLNVEKSKLKFTIIPMPQPSQCCEELSIAYFKQTIETTFDRIAYEA